MLDFFQALNPRALAPRAAVVDVLTAEKGLSPGPHWVLTKPDEIRWAEFGNDSMVFNPVSWETHRVSTIVVLVLEALRDGADTVPAIMRGLPPTDLSRSSLEQGVGRALEDLQGLGIVRALHAE